MSAQSSVVDVLTSGVAMGSVTVGSRVITTANLNVRDAASPAATNLGVQPVGSLGTVIGGPTTISGYVWWQVDYDLAPDGWSIGDHLAVAASVSSPALGMTEQPSLVATLLQQIASLTQQIQSLQAQVAGTGAMMEY